MSRVGYHVLLVSLAFASMSNDRCNAQTVQLPTFHVFSVSTTVVVPDRGTAYLGGVSRSHRTSNSLSTPLFGRLPGVGRGFMNGGISSSLSASGASVSATIIDHDSIDRALLADAARRRGAKVDVLGRPVDDVPKQLPAAMGNRRVNSRTHRYSPSPRMRNVTDVLAAHQAVSTARAQASRAARRRRLR